MDREGHRFGNPWGVTGTGCSGMGGVHSDAAGSVQLGSAQLGTLVQNIF